MSKASQVAHDMLQKIEDPKVRDQYAGILNAEVIGYVYCNSEICAGRVIAHMMADGTCRETEPLKPTKAMIAKAAKDNERIAKHNAKHPDDPEELIVLPHYISGLEGDRIRLDSSRGFRCYCGNNSILHEHEQGHITASAPTKRDIEAVFGKMARNPSTYPESDGSITIDGFTIEGVGE